MNEPTIIYTLSDPFTNKIRYVGKTIKSPHRRLIHHINKAKCKASNHRDYWIKGLLQKGARPVLEELDISYNTDFEVEQYWICQLRAWGFDLTNMTDGGEGAVNRKHSEETKLKIASANKGRIVDAIGRLNMSKSKKGKPWTEKYRSVQKIARKGHKVTEETKKKIAKGHSHPVDCYKLNGEFVASFNSHTECAMSLGLLQGRVSAVVRGERNKHRGYYFKQKT